MCCYKLLPSTRWPPVKWGKCPGTMLVGAVCRTQDFWHWPWQLLGLESNDPAEWELCRAGFRLTQVTQQRILCMGQRKSLTCNCGPKLLLTAIIDGGPLSWLGGSQWMKRLTLDWVHQSQLVKQKQQKKTTQTPVKWFFLELQYCLDWRGQHLNIYSGFLFTMFYFLWPVENITKMNFMVVTDD